MCIAFLLNFVASSGIEPESRASETRILSVVLQGQVANVIDARY